MILTKLIGKIFLLPVMFLLLMLRVLVRIGINLSSIILGGLILIVFGCIIYAVIQQMWPSVFILISIEAFLVMITAGAGVIEGVLAIGSESIGDFLRS